MATLSFGDLLPQRCLANCNTFWIPEAATFGPGCLPLVLYIPAVFSLLVVIVRPVLRALYPWWLRNFADEEESETKPSPDAPPPRSRPWTRSSSVLVSLSLAGAAYAAISAARQRSPLYLMPLVPGLVSAALVSVERPRTMPATVLVVNAVLFLTMLVASLALTGGPELPTSTFPSSGLLLWYFTVFLNLATIWVLVRMPLRDPFLDASDINRLWTTPSSDLRPPEDNFSFWNWMTVDWLEPLIKISGTRQFNEENVWGPPLSWSHSRLFLRLRELRGTLFVRVIIANLRDLTIIPMLSVAYSCLSMGEIVIMKQILGALREETRDTRAALAYAVLTLIFRLLEAQISVFHIWFLRRTYERSRGELIISLYEKALRRKAFTFGESARVEEKAATAAILSSSSSSSSSSSGQSSETASVEEVATTDETTPLLSSNVETAAKTAATKLRFADIFGFGRKLKTPPPPPPPSTEPFVPASAGKLFDLIRYDAYEVAERFWNWGDTFIVPTRLVLSVYLIWVVLGPSAFLGAAVVVVTQVVNILLARVLVRVEKRRRAVSDDMLQIANNFIQAIRYLRWYGWQDKWLGRILEARQRELLLFALSNFLKRLVSFLSIASSLFFPVAAFYGYTVLAGHKLTADIAFPALGLFENLNGAMVDVPNLIEAWLNAIVAMGRINSFMREPDKENVNTDLAPPSPAEPLPAGPPGELLVEISNGSFSWPGTEARHRTLHDVNVVFPVGLTVVRGKVGAGKSALLQALLGELDQHAGERRVPGEMIGYCNQAPWLESLAIRDNILFSAPMDHDRYRRVLDACCLLPDLARFNGGDLSHIGENGVGLSGGQKARVALARAVYSRSRILLLDDPIAALDHNTAETVLVRLFSSNLLRDRVVVFVTHRTDLVLPYADQVVEVHHGKVRVLPPESVEELRRRTARDRDRYECTVGADDAKDAIPEKFIKDEYRAHGAVGASVYWRYTKYGGFWLWAAMFGSMIAYRITRLSYLYFLQQWGDAYDEGQAAAVAAHPLATVKGKVFSALMSESSSGWLDRLRDYLQLPNPADDVMPWLKCFSVITAVMSLLWLLAQISIVGLLYVSGRRIFSDVMHSVTGATFRFYDETPVGRLINRLTSDMRAINVTVVREIQNMAWHSIGWAGSIVVIGLATPLFLVTAVLTTLTFVYLFNRFFPAAQSLRRMEMTQLSPLLSNVGVLLNGLVTVRAFRAEPFFQSRTFKTVDQFQTMDHFYWSCQNWLQYRLDLVSGTATFLLTLFSVCGQLSQGAAGFVLTATGSFVVYTHYLCRTYGELQMQFVSVERILELLDLDQEPAGDLVPPASWPSGADDIVFDNVTVRYAPQLEPAIRSVSFRIPAGSSVAVTGRTGSGKSTLALALLGTILPDLAGDGGDITIGGVSVSRVDKHALRSRISFVAQDAVLFAGTLRDNLDPQNEHSDDECAAILGRVLGVSSAAHDPRDRDRDPDAPCREPFTLASRVDAGGLNLSQGQRQLIGLGRAILRRSAIVILDEATASIDAHTAAEIHNILRTDLAGSTVITIAHRAEAVAGAQYVLEISQGTVKEFRKMEGGESILSHRERS